jgi:hypothetical protein
MEEEPAAAPLCVQRKQRNGHEHSPQLALALDLQEIT